MPSAIAHTAALLLWLCSQVAAQANQAGPPKPQRSRTAVTCTSDSDCPSGHRCGFSGGDCNTKGRCLVPSKTSHCIDPGGRCGCDGRPVDIFCAVGSRIEFTSAPVNAVGPCPRPCTDNLGCASGLTCQNGV